MARPSSTGFTVVRWQPSYLFNTPTGKAKHFQPVARSRTITNCKYFWFRTVYGWSRLRANLLSIRIWCTGCFAADEILLHKVCPPPTICVQSFAFSWTCDGRRCKGSCRMPTGEPIPLPWFFFVICWLWIQSCLRWPIVLSPTSRRKRLIPYLFGWSQAFLSVLLVLQLTQHHALLRDIRAQLCGPVFEAEINQTIEAMIDWIRDLRGCDSIAMWCWNILQGIYGLDDSEGDKSLAA